LETQNKKGEKSIIGRELTDNTLEFWNKGIME
jgi:hypothetical protein